MIRIGIIGAGHIANKFAEAINLSDLNASLEAIASRSIDKANDFKKKYHVKKAYGSYIELYEDRDIDLVYIATPHVFHYKQMLDALDYHKHIICEKPFTINALQAEEIFLKAEEKQCFVMEALWSRFLPVIKELKHNLDQGLIGDIYKLEADFCFSPDKPINHRLFQPQLGGGALLDVGIYPITFANLFLGHPLSIKSKVKMIETGVDGDDYIEYSYPDAKAILTASITHEKKREARIYGSKGYAIIEGLHASESIKIYNLDNQLIKHIANQHETNGFEYEIRDAIACIQQGYLESLVMPSSETISVLSQMDAIRKTWNFFYPQE